MIKDRSSMAARAPAISSSPAPGPLVIDTREELVNALSEAAQLEHGLMLQYLYAAFSIKRFTHEGLSDAQQEQTRGWARRILTIALEEMMHLGTVCNLLVAIGGRPSFARPSFPQPVSRWYPFEFELEKLSARSLERFVRAESPPPAQPIAPDPILYTYVGDLYRAIAAGFETIDADLARAGDPSRRLFIGRPEAQSQGEWTVNFSIATITSVASAKAAIELVTRQGEGTPSGGERSHHGEFRALLQELQDARAHDPSFEPARDVVSNPLTRPQRDAGAGAFILSKRSIAHPVAELLNHTYSTMLMMLSTFFDPAGEAAPAREVVRVMARGVMSGIVRPLAEVLTTLPATEDAHGPRAGAPFEIYGDLGLPAYAPGRIAILVERVELEAGECRRLAELHAGLARLRSLAVSYEYLRAALANLLRDGAQRP